MADIKNISVNIKKYRTLKCMTQTKLGEKLYVTPQTVSKWEKGIALPDLQNLCKIAEILEISVDRLLSPSDRKTGYIGIDGGGTKTEFVLCDVEGHIYKKVLLEGCNPNDIGLEKCFTLLKKGIDILSSEQYEIGGIFAGISGCTAGDNKTRLNDALTKEYPQIPIRVESDIYGVILSHFDSCDQKCITAICGTGSVIFASDGEKLHRIGGWGYLIDNAGSAYDIGRDALYSVLAFYDGLGEYTSLCDAVSKQLGGDVWDKLNEIYSSGKSYIASFAKLVFDEYRKGDEISTQILRRNFERVARLINHAQSSFQSGNTVILSGGLKNNSDILIEFLHPRLNENLELIIPELPPIYGLCKGAVMMKNNLNSAFCSNFTFDYLKEI